MILLTVLNYKAHKQVYYTSIHYIYTQYHIILMCIILHYIYYIEMLRASVEELNEMQGKIQALSQKQTHTQTTTQTLYLPATTMSPLPPDFNRD